MSVLTELTIPADEFVLADTLTASPDMHIEIKRVVGGKSTVTPYLWASGEGFDAFEKQLRDDDMVREVLMLEEQNERSDEDDTEERFYRVTWEMDVPNLITAVSDARATVLEAVSNEEHRWEVKILFPGEQSLSDFHEYCVEHGFSFEPQRVYRPENPEEQAEYGVTAEQQEALEAAYHAGYFDVPRDRTLTDLATELDISRNALSARLRRGQRNLLANTLVREK
ncbi:helix-turn-helix domain-containing protein [Natronosalvus rutilus]|uniref:Helix-turn-helix domain-containing protein n=1 Tax=Natronosalvus rutilus TaxID=2953753 RepID=A0A9E7SUV9_9EURY|nr:helix-turn-helix domain-containing protein [Natronosalvus rutilus]UTF55224.1 helix-turn-helix domain-containing protein [Natronosalvus rutilus]